MLDKQFSKPIQYTKINNKTYAEIWETYKDDPNVQNNTTRDE